MIGGPQAQPQVHIQPHVSNNAIDRHNNRGRSTTPIPRSGIAPPRQLHNMQPPPVPPRRPSTSTGPQQQQQQSAGASGSNSNGNDVMAQLTQALSALNIHLTKPKAIAFKDLPKSLQANLAKEEKDIKHFLEKFYKAESDVAAAKDAKAKDTTSLHPVAKKVLVKQWLTTKEELENAQLFNAKAKWEELITKHAEEIDAFAQQYQDFSFDVYQEKS